MVDSSSQLRQMVHVGAKFVMSASFMRRVSMVWQWESQRRLVLVVNEDDGEEGGSCVMSMCVAQRTQKGQTRKISITVPAAKANVVPLWFYGGMIRS